MVTCLPKLQVEHEGVYNSCALGKNMKGIFPSNDNRSKRVLDLIHSDVCGPISMTSLGGFLYYVNFINELSLKTWIYFLNTKDEVFGQFQVFKAQVENFKGRNIKIISSDNGGYTSKELISFCRETRIKRMFLVPYNPQQNGIIERKNRNIMDVSKAMIHDQDLPMLLWGEASKTIIYVQNRG